MLRIKLPKHSASGAFCIKKDRPGRDGEKGHISNSAAELVTEATALLLGAAALHGKRCFVIQANHSNIAGAIDLPLAVADGYREGLAACRSNKSPQILKGSDHYLKFLHGFPFLRLYKMSNNVYNGQCGSLPHSCLL